MREKPILFNTEMVRAILKDKKTVTRRVMNPQPETDENGKTVFHARGYSRDYVDVSVTGCSGKLKCVPPFKPGDVLWVRETFGRHPSGKFTYKADYIGANGWGWKPSIHMPREAARIFLRVTDVRVERVQEITAQGMRDEGMTSLCVHVGDMEIASQEWKLLWDSTIKPSDRNLYGFDANPYVWVIHFERI